MARVLLSTVALVAITACASPPETPQALRNKSPTITKPNTLSNETMQVCLQEKLDGKPAYLVARTSVIPRRTRNGRELLGQESGRTTWVIDITDTVRVYEHLGSVARSKFVPPARNAIDTCNERGLTRPEA